MSGPRTWTAPNFKTEEIPPVPYNHLFHFGSPDIPIVISDDEGDVKMEPGLKKSDSREKVNYTPVKGQMRPEVAQVTTPNIYSDPVDSTTHHDRHATSRGGRVVNSSDHTFAQTPNVTQNGSSIDAYIASFKASFTAPVQPVTTSVKTASAQPQAASVPATTFITTPSDTLSKSADPITTPSHVLPHFARFTGYGLLEKVCILIICDFLAQLRLTKLLARTVVEKSLAKIVKLYPNYRRSCNMKAPLPSGAWIDTKIFRHNYDRQTSSLRISEEDIPGHVQKVVDSLSWTEFWKFGFDHLTVVQNEVIETDERHIVEPDETPETVEIVEEADPVEIVEPVDSVDASKSVHQHQEQVCLSTSTSSKRSLEVIETELAHELKKQRLNEVLGHFRPAEVEPTPSFSDPDTTAVDAQDHDIMIVEEEIPEQASNDNDTQDTVAGNNEDTTARDALITEDPSPIPGASEFISSPTNYVDTTANLLDTSMEFCNAPTDDVDTTVELAEAFTKFMESTESMKNVTRRLEEVITVEAGSTDSTEEKDTLDDTTPDDTSTFNSTPDDTFNPTPDDTFNPTPDDTFDDPTYTCDSIDTPPTFIHLLQTPLPAAGTENIDFWLCLLPILAATYSAMLY